MAQRRSCAQWEDLWHPSQCAARARDRPCDGHGRPAIDDRVRAATDCGLRAAARDHAFMHAWVIASVIKMLFNRIKTLFRHARWRRRLLFRHRVDHDSNSQSTFVRSIRGRPGPPRIGARRDSRGAVRGRLLLRGRGLLLRYSSQAAANGVRRPSLHRCKHDVYVGCGNRCVEHRAAPLASESRMM